MNKTGLHLGLIGCGKMGQALLGAWERASIADSVVVIDPYVKGLDTSLDCTFYPEIPSNSAIFQNLDAIILAVKPNQIDSICASLGAIWAQSPQSQAQANKNEKTPCVLFSIAAGRGLDSLAKHFSPHTPIIRIMPNTPALIGQGVHVAYAPAPVRQTYNEHVQDIFGTCGHIFWIEEEHLMDAVTAISGSGPAYFFYFTELLAQCGIRAGLPEDLSQALARHTFTGSGALAQACPAQTCADLRTNVTSPGGTTQAALTVLMNKDFENILNTAIQAAKERSKILGTQ